MPTCPEKSAEFSVSAARAVETRRFFWPSRIPIRQLGDRIVGIIKTWHRLRARDQKATRPQERFQSFCYIVPVPLCAHSPASTRACAPGERAQQKKGQAAFP
jgi:hypothetical protein